MGIAAAAGGAAAKMWNQQQRDERIISPWVARWNQVASHPRPHLRFQLGFDRLTLVFSRERKL